MKFMTNDIQLTRLDCKIEIIKKLGPKTFDPAGDYFP